MSIACYWLGACGVAAIIAWCGGTFLAWLLRGVWILGGELVRAIKERKR